MFIQRDKVIFEYSSAFNDPTWKNIAVIVNDRPSEFR